MGHQLSYGLAEKFLKLSIFEGWEDDYPTEWIEENDFEKRKKRRYTTQFNANIFALLLEKELKNSNVEILYGTMVTDVALNKKNDKIEEIKAKKRHILGIFALKYAKMVETTGLEPVTSRM